MAKKPNNTPIVGLSEPIKTQLSPDEITKRLEEFLVKANDIIAWVSTKEDFEKEMWGLISEINNLIWQKSTLEESLDGLQGQVPELNAELDSVNAKLKKTSSDLDTLIFNKIHKIFDRIKQNAFWLTICVALWGIATTIAYHMFDSFNMTPDEQLIVDEKYNSVRSAIVNTLSSIGASPDSDVLIWNFSFERANQDDAFSLRNFFNSKEFYRLTGTDSEYSVHMAIPFKAPESVIVTVWDSKREFTTPSVQIIENYITDEIAILNDIATASELAEQEKLELAASEQDRIAAAAIEQKLTEAELIQERKTGIISVIQAISWQEDYVLGEDIVLEIWEWAKSMRILLHPERLLWDLREDTAWLDNEKTLTFWTEWEEFTDPTGDRIDGISMSFSALEPHNFSFTINYRSITDYSVTEFSLDRIDDFWREIEIELLWRNILPEEGVANEL